MSKKKRDAIIENIKDKLSLIQANANSHGNTPVKKSIQNIHTKILNYIIHATDKGLEDTLEQLNPITETIFNIPDFSNNVNSIISYTQILIAFTILTDANYGDTKQKINKLELDINSYNSELLILNKSIEKFKEQNIDKIANQAERIEQFYNDFFNCVADDDEITKYNTINQMVLEIENSHETIQSNFTDITTKHDDIIKKHDNINEKNNDILLKYNDIISKEPNVSAYAKTITDIYNSIINKQIDENGNPTKESKKEIIDSFVLKIKTLEEQIKKYDKLNDDTNKLNDTLTVIKENYEVREKEYEDLAEKIKEKYSDISKGSLILQHDNNSKYFRNQYRWATIIQLVFLTVIFGVYAFWIIPHLPDTIKIFETIPHQIMFSIFITFSSYIPFKIIMSLNENKIIAKKLAEEYNHKHSLIDSAMGFNDFYKDDKESQKILVDKMITALERNPSDEISHILNKDSKSPLEKVADTICYKGEDVRDSVKNTVANVSDIFKKNNKQSKTAQELLENTDDGTKAQEETQ